MEIKSVTVSVMQLLVYLEYCHFNMLVSIDHKSLCVIMYLG